MNEDEICVICRDAITNRCQTNNCTHSFCKGCLCEWTKENNVCPVCRASITSVSFNNGNEIEEQQIHPPAPAEENEDILVLMLAESGSEDSDSSFEDGSDSSWEPPFSLFSSIFSDSDFDSTFDEDYSDGSDNAFSDSDEAPEWISDDDGDSSSPSPSNASSLMIEITHNNPIPTTTHTASPEPSSSSESSGYVDNEESSDDEPPCKRARIELAPKSTASSTSPDTTASNSNSTSSWLEASNKPSNTQSDSSVKSSCFQTDSAFFETSNSDSDSDSI